ncbi:hypothetical protein Cgig2_025336 [Carnegiea gigantea]|uniref:Uncharacterized protein n=1 Tax=Carnegiea gigantea TaxID=171969 RepID=A0A9Q1JRZ9_9CARY|nr:hypothetical protein Cgig2_025336 [Carnegiea gigantea]
MEESREKMGSTKNLQINGFAMILQVWFYEHNTIYAFAIKRKVPRLSSWVNLYNGKKYDGGVMVRKLKDSELIPVIEVRDDERRMQAVEALITSEDYGVYVEDAQLRGEPYVSSVHIVCCVVDKRERDALRKEREALAKEPEVHVVTKKELKELTEAVAMKTTIEDILEFARLQGLHSTEDAPERSAAGEEGTNTDIFAPDVGGEVDWASSSSPVQSSDVAETTAAGERAHPVDAELVVEGEVGKVQWQSPADEERPKSSIAKRVRTCPRPRNPYSMQSSLYLHPDRAVTKGKHKCGNAYISRKWSKKVGGVSAAHVAGTDVDVGGAPAGKVYDASPLGSSENANVEAIMRAVAAEEGFPMGKVRVDDVEGCVDVGMVAEEGTVEAAEGTALSRNLVVDYVHNSTDKGGEGGRQSPCDVVVDAGTVVTSEKSNECVGKDGPDVATQSEKGGTYDGPMAAGVDAVRCETHGTEAQTSGIHSAVTVVVTTSEGDSLPTSFEATQRRQPPATTAPTCKSLDKFQSIA